MVDSYEPEDGGHRLSTEVGWGLETKVAWIRWTDGSGTWVHATLAVLSGLKASKVGIAMGIAMGGRSFGWNSWIFFWNPIFFGHLEKQFQLFEVSCKQGAPKVAKEKLAGIRDLDFDCIVGWGWKGVFRDIDMRWHEWTMIFWLTWSIRWCGVFSLFSHVFSRFYSLRPQPCSQSRNGDARTVLSDAETALQQLLRGANAAEAKKALQTLSMILQNLTSHPTQEKYKVREDGRGIMGYSCAMACNQYDIFTP